MKRTVSHEFRFRQYAPDGRCFLDIPASADVESSDGIGDVRLNGATISGPLREAVVDFMIETGVVDTMRRLSLAEA